MSRHISWLASTLLIISCLASASCGGGTVASKDAEAPLSTVSPSATTTPGSTPLTDTPQATPSPETPATQDGSNDVVMPKPSPLPGGLNACIGRAAAPAGPLNVVGQTPLQVLSGYARGIYAANADGSALRYVANVSAWTATAGASGGLSWSPAGTKVAFVGSTGDGASLIVLDLMTGEMRNLPTPGFVYRIAWDGEEHVMLWEELSGQATRVLTQVPLDGGPPVQLVTLPEDGGNLAWSPNGQCFVLSFQGANWKNETDVFARDGTPLTGVQDAAQAVWSPDGSTLALECGNGGPFKTCVWPLGDSRSPRPIGDGYPEAWSARGDSVVVSVWSENGAHIGLFPAEGSASQVLIDGTSPALSSDDVHLALVRDGNVYVRNLSTSNETRVTDSIIPYMREPSWSPDGSTLLFAFNPGDSDIYVANADGSGERLLTVGHAPEWSPDGTRIEFAVGEAALGAWGSLYAADIAGGSLVRLGDYSFDDIGDFCIGASGDSWSPNGKYIVYYTENGANVKGGMYLAPSDGSASPLQIGGGSGPNWSPKGDELVFTGSVGPPYTCAVFTQTISGRQSQRLAEGAWAAWSPRGDLIAFIVNAEVHVIKPDGSGERVVVEKMTSDTVPFSSAPYAPSWSPDGRKLAFRFADSADQAGIYVVDVDSPGPARLVTDGTAESWTPDGQKLVVSRFEDRRFVSYLVNVDGSGEQKLVDGDGVDWSPDGSKILFSR